MRVLVACEESQAVTKELRRLGHEAYSCDIQPCSGGHPEWHIKGDVLEIVNGMADYGGWSNCAVLENGGIIHVPEKWDMIIAHPPCTHLCSSGARWFTEGKKPWSLQEDAAEFFMKFANADCPRIAIENPIGVMSTKFRKPDQIIQPWQFGHGETKATCLWLKGLPKLVPTEIVDGREHRIHRMPPSPERAKLRSKTFPGIARAMAEQWAGDARGGCRMNNDLMFSSKNQAWETPKDFFDKYDAIFHFETDVCALPENAKCKRFFTPEMDGLKQEWTGVCWMNPPYGRQIGKWVRKAYESARDNLATVVCLLPARTDTRWFHDYILPHAEVQFIKGRIKFGGAKEGAPFPNMIVTFFPGGEFDEPE